MPVAVNLPERAVFLVADPVRLSQVVTNLLTNAARYTPGGGRIPTSAAMNVASARRIESADTA